MSEIDPAIWERLGIAATADVAEIRRAYASQLRALDRDVDAQDFELLRAAYAAAIKAARSSETQSEEETDLDLPAEPSPARQQAQARRQRVAGALAIAGEEAALAELREMLAEDLGLAASEELELELAGWLLDMKAPPLPLVGELVRHFYWYERQQRVSEELPAEAQALLGHHLGWRELAEIGRLAANDQNLLAVIGDWLNGALDLEAAAERLRRARLNRSHLAAVVRHWPNAFAFAIPAELFRWLYELLPEAPPPGPWERFQRMLAIDGSVLVRVPGELAAGLLFTAVLGIAMGREWTSIGIYGWLAAGLPLVVELTRGFAEERPRHVLPWLPTALLWSLLGLAAAASLGFRAESYAVWWTAGMLAIHLSFEKERSKLELIADLIGYAMLALGLVGPLEAPPFLFVLAPPLLSFPGKFFGRFAPRPEVGRNLLRAIFALAVLAATWMPPASEEKPMFGLAMVGLFLLWRAELRGLESLWIAPGVVWLAARIAGFRLAEQPLALLIHLWPLLTAMHGSRWIERLLYELWRPRRFGGKGPA